MTAPEDAQDRNEQDSLESGPPRWLGALGRAIAPPQAAPDAAGPPRIVQRITRAQKIMTVLGALGVLTAFLATAPPLPFMSGLQEPARGIVGADEGYAYPTAVVLMWMLVMAGAMLQALVIGWRLARFPLPLLVFFLAGGALFNFYFTSSPRRIFVGWLVIATGATAYIHYYRKGRFGYTRGASAAVYSYISLLLFFIALPLTLVELWGGRWEAAQAEAELSARCAEWMDDTLLGRMWGNDVGEPPEECRREDERLVEETPPQADRPEVELPAHDVRVVSTQNRIEIATNATSPEELRALFDSQREQFRTLSDSDTDPIRQLEAADRPGFEVLIRCASVPDLPGVDPSLATGAFALSPPAAEQMGLASTDDVVFETTDRSDCNPLPLPWDAVTADEVFAAAEQAGLQVTNPQDTLGFSTCYAVGCLQQTTTDQFLVTVWPTAEAAESWSNRQDAQMKAAAATLLLTGGTAGIGAGGGFFEGMAGVMADASWIMMAQGAAGADRSWGTVRFGPVTTVDVVGSGPDIYQELSCRDSQVEKCVETYMARLESAAVSLERGRNAASEPND